MLHRIRQQRPQQIKVLFIFMLATLIGFDVVSFYLINQLPDDNTSFLASHIDVIHIAITALALLYGYRKVQQQIRGCALHDATTNILNRHAFHKLLTAEVARSKRHHRVLSLIIIDLDNFKQVNATFNHSIGDDVLNVLSQKMHGLIRHSDYLCRIGGEEFAIIVPETKAKDAQALAEKIRRTVENTDFSPVSHITISAGIGEFTPQMSFDDLVTSACEALKKAKQQGRNKVVNNTTFFANSV